jgi:uncharacterized protein
MVVKDPVDLIALILVIVGGLNWELVGLFNFDLVAAISELEAFLPESYVCL